MNSASTSPAVSVIVFGAFDRHNFGDLLFPHIVSSLLPQHKLIFAGLAARDLREFGGHEVQSLPALLRDWNDDAPIVLHAGGELLGCEAWEAAIMLQTHAEAEELIRRYHDQSDTQQVWASSFLEVDDAAPYIVSPARLPSGSRILHNAIGGMDLNFKPGPMRAEVVAKLRTADAIGVRDRLSLQHLSQAGIKAVLLPDPAALTTELFGPQIAARSAFGEPAAILKSFPRGYLALQFSSDFGDDLTLDIIAHQLRQLVKETGYGIVLFRAGAAPWHDELDVYRRLAERFAHQNLRVFQSLHLWDICALITNSRAYCGSSLHGRIVAMAHGLPRLNLVRTNSSQDLSKQAAYAAAWDSDSTPHVTTPSHLCMSLVQALAVPLPVRRQISVFCAKYYRDQFARLCERAGI